MDQSVEVTKRVLEEIVSERSLNVVGVRLWDGTEWPDDRPRQATLVLNHPGALRRMFLPGNEIGLAEAYLFDDFDIDGDIESVFALADDLTPIDKDFLKKARLGWKLLRLPKGNCPSATKRFPARMRGERHSIDRDHQAIAYHYDVSNDFYSLWLDKNMVYSCAYFLDPEDSLDHAQESKLDYICRKLRLRPGQRLLDIGCGWGGLVIYAAKHYGVEVMGITLSQPQADLANERIAQAGLAERCRVEVCDYRELDENQRYEAMASIGMFEHVGEARLGTYFQQAWKLLHPGGRFLNHGITRCANDTPRRGHTFSDTYVFPDGELVPISTSLRIAEEVGFEVRDVESLREHYAMTLRRWVSRLEANHDEALEFVDEPTYRIWRLFMSGSAHSFTRGRLNVQQSLLVKPDPDGQSGLPLTRADLYVVNDERVASSVRLRF